MAQFEFAPIFVVGEGFFPSCVREPFHRTLTVQLPQGGDGVGESASGLEYAFQSMPLADELVSLHLPIAFLNGTGHNPLQMIGMRLFSGLDGERATVIFTGRVHAVDAVGPYQIGKLMGIRGLPLDSPAMAVAASQRENDYQEDEE